MRPNLGQLARLELLRADGQPIALGSLWAAQPTAIVWLRHFGCPFCLLETRQLLQRRSELERFGRLVLIGTGSPAQAAAFQRRYASGITVLSDQSRRSYRMVGAHRSPWRMVHWRDLGGYLDARRLHLFGEDLQGDALQLGAAAVVAPPQRLLFLQVSRSPGDLVDAEALVGILQDEPHLSPVLAVG